MEYASPFLPVHKSENMKRWKHDNVLYRIYTIWWEGMRQFFYAGRCMIAPCHKNNGDLKIRRQWRQRERHKSNRFKKQNNNFARVSHLFVQFFAVFSLLRREKSLISCFIEDVKVILRGTIFSATRTALKHCCDVVLKGCSVVPTIILFWNNFSPNFTFL